MKHTIIIIIISSICGALCGIGGYISIGYIIKSPNSDITQRYASENAVIVSPHSLRKRIDKKEAGFILVDLRSAEEYLSGHIVGAVNIPAYKDKDHSDYDAVDRITHDFGVLQENHPQSEIIVYCYSRACMTGRKVGLILAQRSIYVKHLGIGRNEWKYDRRGWNHEHEWTISKATDYISSGSGDMTTLTKKDKESTACPIDSELGC